MRYNKCMLLLFIIILAGCAQRDSSSLKTITLSELTQQIEQNDPYTFIDEPKKNGNNLSLTVEYAGGCKEHEFNLVWAGTILFSSPSQIPIYLIHDNRGDTCETLIKEILSFDISRLEKESDSIIYISDFHKNIHVIDPSLGAFFEVKTWIEVNPIQCLGNPWEQDWLEQNKDSYKEGVDPYEIYKKKGIPDQLAIVKAYYARQGKIIYDAQILTYKEVFGEDIITCGACSCSDGYVLYLSIPQNDLTWWLNFVYTNKEATSEPIDLHFKISEGPKK